MLAANRASRAVARTPSAVARHSLTKPSRHLAPTHRHPSSPSLPLTTAAATKTSPCSPCSSPSFAVSRYSSSPSTRNRVARSIHAQDRHPGARGLATVADAADEVEHADVAIVGGGVVGLALACAIASSPAFRSMQPRPKIVLVEASSMARLRDWPPAAGASNALSPVAEQGDGVAWENRIVSLNSDNLQWLHEIGVARHLVASRTRPIQSMHVTDGLTGSAIDFDAPPTSRSPLVSASAPPALSAMVELSNLQQAMLASLQQAESVTVLDATRVESVEPGSSAAGAVGAAGGGGALEEAKDPWPTLHLAPATAPPASSSSPSKDAHNAHSPSSSSSSSTSTLRPIRARLLVGADGGNSPVRRYAEIDASGYAYGRKGLVATLRLNPSDAAVGRMNDGVEWMRRAYQRFLPTGPIAWLPLSDSTASMVWTLPTELADALTAVHRESKASAAGDGELLAHLVTAAWRLPWRSLSPILDRVGDEIARRREEKPSGAQAQQRPGGVAAPSKGDAARDWSWLASEIGGSLAQHEADAAAAVAATSGGGASGAASAEVPPRVASVDARSVASFPLRVSHAEAYLGSSLASGKGEGLVGLDVGSAGDDQTASLRSVVGTLASGVARLLAPVGGTAPASVATGRGRARGRGRTALVGDAAHSIHPLAGQGLNLGLADARALAETLASAALHGADLGSHTCLEPYAASRWSANQAMLTGVDALHRLFSVPVPDEWRSPSSSSSSSSPGVQLASRAVVWARSTGMEVLNELAPIKLGISRHAGSGARETTAAAAAAAAAAPGPPGTPRAGSREGGASGSAGAQS